MKESVKGEFIMKIGARFISLVIALAAPTFAGAQTLTYNVAGTFVGGSVLSGSFTFDPTKNSFAQYSNVNLTASGIGTGTDIGGIGPYYANQTNGIFGIGTSLAPNDIQLNIGFNAIHNGDNLIAITSSVLNASDTYYYLNNRQVGLVSGTISPAVTAAVPEPATWALMVFGMGAVGFGMRRRNVATRVVFG